MATVLCSAVTQLVSGLDRSQSLILQQYIGTRPGKDLRVWVIGSQVIGAMLRSSTDGSFKANISRGGDGQAFPLNPELERLARDSAAALNLDIAGVDLSGVPWSGVTQGGQPRRSRG